MADLGEPGVGEDAATADMELPPGDLLARLRDHRVALEGAGAAVPNEVDGCARERAADATAAEARAGKEAGRGPNAVIGLVLRSARPGNPAEAHVGRTRLDRAPAHGLAVEVRDEAARRVCGGLTAPGLFTQPVGAFLDRRGIAVPLRAPDLEALAPAARVVAARAEDSPEILPARLVGRDDRDLGRHRRVGHAETYRGLSNPSAAVQQLREPGL